eukprot:Platyproteum_vivax@DN14846_c0_g1_i1.p1
MLNHPVSGGLPPVVEPTVGVPPIPTPTTNPSPSNQSVEPFQVLPPADSKWSLQTAPPNSNLSSVPYSIPSPPTTVNSAPTMYSKHFDIPLPPPTDFGSLSTPQIISRTASPL